MAMFASTVRADVRLISEHVSLFRSAINDRHFLHATSKLTLEMLFWYILQFFAQASELFAQQTLAMPCCLESLGINACTRLKLHKPRMFKQKCETLADFALVQCCHTCQTDVQQFGLKVFAHGDRSRQCYDRHDYDYCKSFVDKKNGWDMDGQMRCNGDGATLGFRICRRTCGYCNTTLYEENVQDKGCPMIG